jgi:copper chaperone
MKTTIKVKGMSCGGCRLTVENVLKRVPGVLSADVSLEKAEAVVEFDDKKAALKDLRAAIVDAGFTAP